MSGLYDEMRQSLRDTAALRGLLAGATDDRVWRRIVEELLDRPDDLRACARWSFRHTLGFEKLVLIAEPPLQMLRLHLWRPGQVLAAHVHNHRADIASAVLRGRLDKKLYRRAPGGTVLEEYRETDTGDAWGLRPWGPAALELDRSVRVEPGTAYALPAPGVCPTGSPPAQAGREDRPGCPRAPFPARERPGRTRVTPHPRHERVSAGS
ncbi:MAG: hypothetical protein ABIS86_10665 [Streptosporangiaceae bacterium]